MNNQPLHSPSPSSPFKYLLIERTIEIVISNTLQNNIVNCYLLKLFRCNLYYALLWFKYTVTDMKKLKNTYSNITDDIQTFGITITLLLSVTILHILCHFKHHKAFLFILFFTIQYLSLERVKRIKKRLASIKNTCPRYGPRLKSCNKVIKLPVVALKREIFTATASYYKRLYPGHCHSLSKTWNLKVSILSPQIILS